MENYEKLKKIEDMEEQRSCHSMFQKDIIEENNKLRSFVEKCNEYSRKITIVNQIICNNQF